MKKIFILLGMLLFMGSISFAQNTVVSATVTDSQGTVWAGGNWKIQFIPNAANQNLSQYNQNGVKLLTTVMNQAGFIDGSGNFSVTVYDSTTITPIGSSWTLTVCPLATSACGIYNFATAGPTQNISSALTFIIPPPSFQGVQGNFGYNDAEAIPTLNPGSTYYDVTLQCQKYYNTSSLTWVCVSGSGGSFCPITGCNYTGPIGSTDITASTAFHGILVGSVTGHSSLDVQKAGDTITGNLIGSGCGAGTFLLADNSGICGIPPGSSNATQIQGTNVDTTTPTNGQTLVFSSGAGKYIPQNTGNVLPSATDTFNKVLVNAGGVGSIQSAQNSFYDAVATWGVDNTGVTNVTTLLQTKINSLCALNTPAMVYLPAGTYLISSGLEIDATISTCSGIQVVGAGRDVTILQSTCASSIKFLIRLVNTTNPGDNWLGQRFSDFTVKDTSGTGACQYGLLIEQGANVSIERVKSWGFQGVTYSAGTITISGSTVTGSGTTFISDMVQGKLQVTQSGVTYRATICSFTSTTFLTLCSTSFPTGNIAAPASYAIAYRGHGLGINGGNSYSQYISIRDYFGYGDLECMTFFGSSTALTGVSRISVEGKNGGCDGLRIPNSIGWSSSRRVDTINISGRTNNVSVCGYNDSSHANRYIGADCEMNSTYTPVTTCNGGVATQSCNVGWEITSDSNGDGWNNTWIAPYAYLVGTVYQFDNSTGAFNSTILGDLTLAGSYLNHYFFSGTTGCPGNGSGIKSLIFNYDCNHSLVAQTVN